MNRLVFIVACAALTTGCAKPPVYQWGQYDELLYRGYKDPAQIETMRLKLEGHVATLESSRAKVPPGVYAELGTLNLQKGDSNAARAFYVKERDAWPESRGLMDAMISNIDRRAAGGKGASS